MLNNITLVFFYFSNIIFSFDLGGAFHITFCLIYRLNRMGGDN